MATKPNPNQSGFDFSDTEEANTKANSEKAQQKAKDFVSEDPEYAKRLTQREEAKKQDETMRKIVQEKAAKRTALTQSSMISPKGNITRAGSGSIGGEGGVSAELKMLNNPKAMRAGGMTKCKVDGIALRGKTRAKHK
jgi:hypothetical protein